MKLRRLLVCLMVLTTAIVASPGVAFADYYRTYRDAKSLWNKVYTQTTYGPRTGGRVTVPGRVWTVYLYTKNTAGRTVANASTTGGQLVMRHAPQANTRSACKWWANTLKKESKLDMKCEARTLSN